MSPAFGSKKARSFGFAQSELRPTVHGAQSGCQRKNPSGSRCSLSVFMLPTPHNRPQIKAACRDGVARGASRRRSNLAPLALATRLGEKRREHRLHRPRLAFRAGGAPLAVLADRLLEAEALPAPGAAVLVDRHRRRKAIPARTGRSSRPQPEPSVDTSERTCLKPKPGGIQSNRIAIRFTPSLPWHTQAGSPSRIPRRTRARRRPRPPARTPA